MTTKVSVLICTRDRPETVGQAVESVARCNYPEFDLHVMDQSATDATKHIVEDLAARYANRCSIVYHHLDKAGLSRAYNLGVQTSDGPYIACTDDDVVVPRDWITHIAKDFDDDAALGLIYGQVLVPESLREALSAGTIIPNLTWSTRERLHRADSNFKVWGMGANMAMRRSTFERVGGFDEVMGGGAPLRSSQDHDFAYRTYRVGYAVLLDPDIAVDHYGARTREQWPSTAVAYGIGDGAFYSKHIRCRDLLAVKLFAYQLARVARKTLGDCVRARRIVPLGDYGRSLLGGVHAASHFDIDCELRLYCKTERAKLGVTEANAITSAVRDDGALRD